MNDLQVKYIKTHVTYCDNQSALHIKANPIFHERAKHLEIDFHIVRKKQTIEVMRLLLVKSKDQLADFFTKSLHPQPFHTLLCKLKMVDKYQP